MLKSMIFLRKNLRVEEKCCNFASAIGKRRGAAAGPEAGSPGAKIENNDMMPQDKQRQSIGLDAAETREHEVISRGSRQEDSNLIYKEAGQTNFEDI